MKTIKKKKQKGTDCPVASDKLLPSPSFSLFSFMRGKQWQVIRQISDYFNFAQVLSRLAKKKTSFRGWIATCFVLYRTLRLPWALPFHFLFYLPAYLPIYTRLFVFLPHFASASARVEKNYSVETQYRQICDIVTYRIVSTFEAARNCLPIQHNIFSETGDYLRLIESLFFLQLYFITMLFIGSSSHTNVQSINYY